MTRHIRRPPAVPLVTIDPYTSIWSCADRLADDPTRHWTGTRMGLYAVARVDGVAYRLMGGPGYLDRAAEQLDLRVRATTTEYRFRCGPVEVGLDFVTPLLLDDLDLLSRPVGYVTFFARALDGRAREVACYLDMTGEIATNLPHERVHWARQERDGVVAMTFRHDLQPVLEKSGDHLRIDWGTAYLAGRREAVTAAVGDIDAIRDAFAEGLSIEGRGPFQPPPRKVSYIHEAVVALSFAVRAEPRSAGRETVLVGYDDEWSVEYFGRPLRPWWRRGGAPGGPLDGMGALALAMRERDAVLARAAAFDDALEGRARALAGDAYAELCALAWRQAVSAHKLCEGPDGRPLFLSKENFSNGCIGTVDVTYPSAPLFLAFNPALLGAMIDPYFEYCEGPDWPFPFAAHDLGVYPKANGQAYRGFDRDRTLPVLHTQMPVEECGNMLVLAGALHRATGDLDALRRRWPLLCRWAAYLAEAGHDPGEQLCTDDFAGVLGRNVNLSCKAAVGLACHAVLAEALGDAEAARASRAHAEAFAAHILAARDGEGTPLRLAFGAPGTWSLKYNLVWDRLLGLGLFPEAELRREMDSYAARAEPCGVPLDNRSALTKPEWMLWAASLAHDPALFRDLVDRVARYANTTPNRVPLGDLYFAHNGRAPGFQARSVVGGLFVAFLEGWEGGRVGP